MQPSEGIPFELPLPDEDENDLGLLQAIYEDLDPNDPLLADVDSVVYADPAEDGLEARHDDRSERGGALDPALMDWRIQVPDDPRGQVVQVRVSDALIKKADHLISKTRGEVWANRSDIIREAVYHYIRSVLVALQVEDATLVSMLAEAELAGRATFHSTRRKRLNQATEHVRDYLTDLVNLDDYEEAHRFILEMAVRVRSVRVVSWRRHWLVALNALPIMKVTIRLLEINGWEIPHEFYPAIGKVIIPSGGIIAPP